MVRELARAQQCPTSNH